MISSTAPSVNRDEGHDHEFDHLYKAWRTSPEADASDGDRTARSELGGRVLAALALRDPAWPVRYSPPDPDGADAWDPWFQSRRAASFLSSSLRAPLSEDVQRLGRYVRHTREASGMSRTDLARRAWPGLDPVAIVLVEHGLLSGSELSRTFLSRLALGLDIPSKQLEVWRQEEALPWDLAEWIRNSLVQTQSPQFANTFLADDVDEGDTSLITAESCLGLPVGEITDAGGRTHRVVPVLLPEVSPAPGFNTLALRLIDARGNPVAHRRVRLTLVQIAGLEDEEPVAKTDADGVVRFVRVPVDRFIKVVKDRALQFGVEKAYPVTLLDD